MTLADLRDLPVRFSHLKAYGRSPAHGYHARVTDMKSTSSMQIGTAVDALIFGHRKVCGYPGAVRHGKKYDAFCADHPDTEILTMNDYDKAYFMADAVLSNEAAKPWLQGVKQQTLRFEYMGLQCRATPDVRGDGFLTELKTSVTADPAKFFWQSLRMQYHVQLWMQSIACEIHGYKVPRHMIVCCENSAPYPVTVFEIQDRAKDMAARTLALWCERLKTCEASGQYPGYAQSIVPLDVPEEDVELVYSEAEDEAA